MLKTQSKAISLASSPASSATPTTKSTRSKGAYIHRITPWPEGSFPISEPSKQCGVQAHAMWSTSKTNVEYKQEQCGVQADRFSLQRTIYLPLVGVLEELSSAASFRSGTTRGEGYIHVAVGACHLHRGVVPKENAARSSVQLLMNCRSRSGLTDMLWSAGCS
jgi:hypothetical protein